MIYIYSHSGVITSSETLPNTEDYIAIDHLDPEPVKPFHRAVLCADFITRCVWWSLIYVPQSIQEWRDRKINEIHAYDTSASVNSFTLGIAHLWLDKSTRVGLMNSITIEKEAGRTTTTLWFSDVQYTLPIDTAIGMLNALELYALECYNVTAQHLAAVSKLTTVEEINAYDYTVGYPEKLVFNI